MRDTLNNSTFNKAVEFRPTESNEILINPYGGMVNYGIESCYGDSVRYVPDYIYPESILYLRPCWGDLEPEEGKLDLAVFDETIKNHISRGAKQWSFRIVTFHNRRVCENATPKWVQDAGAKGNDFGIKGFEPHYGDPIYLEKFSNFIHTLAKRYDGDPTLAFVDISGFGLYGEWGDPLGEQPGWDNARVREKDLRAIIDIFFDAFKKTHIAMNTHIWGLDNKDRYEILYALNKGAWIRRDGVGSPFFHEGHKKLVEKYWRDRPIVAEMYAIYSTYQDSETGRNKNWSGWSYLDALLQSVDQHGAFAEMSRDLDITDKAILHPRFVETVLNVGYRLVPAVCRFPDTIKRNSLFVLEQRWKNQAAAKLYVKHPLKISFVDNNKDVAFSYIDNNFDPTDWERGEVYMHFSAFVCPVDLLPGNYDVLIGIVDEQGNECIRLGIEGADELNRYTIGKITVSEEIEDSVPTYSSINLARLPDATGHVACSNKNRPLNYCYPVNDGVMRVSVSDAPGDLFMVRQGYGVTWTEERTFTALDYYAGDCIPGEGGWFERDLWIEAYDGENWIRVENVYWSKPYPYSPQADRQCYRAYFPQVRAKGVRVSGLVGRRHSRYVSVCEIEVYDTPYNI